LILDAGCWILDAGCPGETKENTGFTGQAGQAG